MTSNALELNEEDAFHLRVFLESQAAVGAKFHAHTAKVLFDKYLSITEVPERMLLGLEIFCKLMQVLEDVALHSLTWLEAERTKDPLGAFLSTSSRDIAKFYSECERGMASEKAWQIHGIPSPEMVSSSGILAGEQLDNYRIAAELYAEIIRVVFRGFAEAYIKKVQDGLNTGRYGDGALMFFNIKHGVKIIWRTEKTAGMFDYKNLPITHIPIFISESAPVVGSDAKRHLYFGGLNMDEEFVRGMMENCYHGAMVLSGMAEERLHWLEDPFYSARRTWDKEKYLKQFHDILADAKMSEEEKQSLRERWPIGK